MLEHFCSWVNNEVGGEGPLPDLGHLSYGERVGQSLRRHFEEDRQKNGLRISGLGKPAVLQALAKLGYAEPEPKGRMRWTFHLGDIYEHWVGEMLLAYGYEILCDQMDAEATYVEHLGVGGHYDYLIKTPEEKQLLVEVKTMSPNYARKFRRNPTDTRGYVTQLAMYQAALSGIPAVWLCLDKGTGETFRVVPLPGVLQAALARVEAVLPRLEAVEVETDVLRLFQAPPPEPELYRNAQTGELIVPESMRWSPFAPAFYEIEENLNRWNTPTLYVVGRKDPVGMCEELERLVDEGLVTRK